MSDYQPIGPYVNHILRGIQEALETDCHAQELIALARRAREAEKALDEIVRAKAEWAETNPVFSVRVNRPA